jgi:hypothetical protein
VSGKKYTAADGFSHRPQTLLERQEIKQENDLNEFITIQLAPVNVLPIHTLPWSPSATARIYPFGFGDDLDEDEEKPQKDGLAKPVYKAASALNSGYSNVS